MSVEARLQALIQSYRAQFGDAALTGSPQLIAQLSVQAPDLHGEIKALAAALRRGDAARIAAAADQEGEASRVATEIAGSEKLSMAVATAGVAIARGLGPVAAAPAAPPSPPAPNDAGWAGETVMATPAPGGPAQPYAPPGSTPGYVAPGSATPAAAQPGAAQPIYKNKFVIGAVAIAIVLLLVWSRQSSGPGGADKDKAGPQTAGSYPTLSLDETLPTLSYTRDQNGLSILFQLDGQGGAAPGVVVLPANGWDQGPTQVAFGRPGDVAGRVQVMNEGSVQMQRMQGNGRPARAGRVQWQRDGLNLGPVCIAFQGRAGQSQGGDVGLSGTTMCVMDGDCQRSVGCGRIQ
ncbi:MAG: hypothetical protein AB7H79_03520 [Sphingomonas sp.]